MHRVPNHYTRNETSTYVIFGKGKKMFLGIFNVLLQACDGNDTARFVTGEPNVNSIPVHDFADGLALCTNETTVDTVI